MNLPLCFSSRLRAAQELLSPVVVALKVPRSSPGTGPLPPRSCSALGHETLVPRCHWVRCGHWSFWVTPESGFLVQMLQKVFVLKGTPKMSPDFNTELSHGVQELGEMPPPWHSHIAGASLSLGRWFYLSRVRWGFSIMSSVMIRVPTDAIIIVRIKS